MTYRSPEHTPTGADLSFRLLSRLFFLTIAGLFPAFNQAILICQPGLREDLGPPAHFRLHGPLLNVTIFEVRIQAAD